MLSDNQEFLSMLGTVHDTVIARKFNVSKTAVLKHRRLLDIPACTDKKQKCRPIPPGLLQDLGKFSDKSLSRRYKVSFYYVNSLRRSRNIPVYSG